MKKIFPMLLIAAALAACNPTPVYTQPAAYQQQPQIVQQVPVAAAPVIVNQSHDSGAGTLLTGMALGHMLSSGSNGSSRGGDTTHVQKTTVVNKTVIVQQAAPAPAPTRAASFSGSSYGAARSSASMSTAGRSSFSSSRASFSSSRSGRR